jgi:hypothetical protein
MEKYIGDVWDRKQFEYTVVAKVKHESKEGTHVYLVSQREFGTDEHNYYIQEF